MKNKNNNNLKRVSRKQKGNYETVTRPSVCNLRRTLDKSFVRPELVKDFILRFS